MGDRSNFYFLTNVFHPTVCQVLCSGHRAKYLRSIYLLADARRSALFLSGHSQFLFKIVFQSARLTDDSFRFRLRGSCRTVRSEMTTTGFQEFPEEPRREYDFLPGSRPATSIEKIMRFGEADRVRYEACRRC